MPLSVLQQVVAAPTPTPWHWIAIAFASLGELLGFVFVFRVLTRGGSPASTLLWVVVILAAPWLGLCAYYLFPHRLALKRLRRLRRPQPQRRGAAPSSSGRPTASPPAGRTPAADSVALLQALLAGADADGVSEGNEVHWLPTGGDFFVAAAEAIERARTSVHFVVYIFRPDATGRRFLDLLTAAAARGVAVRLLFDGVGSFGLKAMHLEALRAAGGRAEAFLPLLWRKRPFTVNLRNHRKLLVVDGEVAFLGGRNIGDEYATDRKGREYMWLDAMVRMRGPVVSRLQHVFAEDWFRATDEELTDDVWFPVQAPAGKERVGVVRSGPDRQVPELWWAMLQAIGGACRTIDISSPYLVPPPALVTALSMAVARGVRVRVHTNGAAAEAALLHHAQRSYYLELLQLGIDIHETLRDYNHVKVLVVDGRSVVIGSANLDLRSVYWNFEIAAVLPDAPALAQQITAELERRLGLCRQVTRADVTGRPLQQLLDGAARLLSPLL